MSFDNHNNGLGDYNLHSVISSVKSNQNNLQKNIIITDYLIHTQNNVINNFVFNKHFDSDNNWDIEESLIQLYNDMYELLKFFIENQYLKAKDLPEDHVDLKLSDKNIEIYSKTFLLILQEIHGYIAIKPFDIFMILSNILNEEKIPNVNQQKFKVSSKKHESTKLKSVCISLMNHIIITFSDDDKKYQTLFPTIIQTVFKHLKKQNQLDPYFFKQLLKFLKNIMERSDISREYCTKFQKYFNENLHETPNKDEDIQGLLIDIYFMNLIDHKQMNELKLVEDILKKLSLLRFDFKHSSNVSNVVVNTLIYYHVKKDNQLTLDNILEIYSRLITDNLDSRLGLVATFESLQIFCEYMILSEQKDATFNMRNNLFDLLKKFIDLTLPYIEINSVVDYSLFLELFNKTIFDNIISKYLSKNQLLQILNNLMTKGHYIVDRLEALNFTLFYLNLSHQCIITLKNDIVDESLIEKIEKRLSSLSRESSIFQIRINSNIVLKDFFKNVGNETNSKISPLINESFSIVNKSLQLIDVNQFNFPKIHGNALIIANLSSIVIGEQSLVLKVLVNLVNFLKNTSHNLIINGKISYYKILISWLIIIGLLNNSDRVTVEILSLQRNQLILLWNNLFLSSSFGMSTENEDELYKLLEIQYHALTALMNFATNYHLTESELKQTKKILVKISNFKYNIGGKIVDNLLLQIELKVFMIYRILIQKYNSDFNNNSLLLVLTKNISNVEVFEDKNKNILTEFLKESKAEDTEVAVNDHLEKLLKMNDSYCYGLTSLVSYKGVKLDSNEVSLSFQYYDNNEHIWNNFLKEMIMTPFVSSYYNDHLRILTSHTALKSKKITTEIIDNSLLLLIDSFKSLNSTIQLSLLQNLHVNLTAKNIIKDRLRVIQLNVLVMIHSILTKSKLNEYDEEVHNLILKILNAIEKDVSPENYSIILLGQTRATLNFNKCYHSDELNNVGFKKSIDDIVQKLIGEDQTLKKLSLIELGYTIQLNLNYEKNVDELNDIIKLILDIGFDLENLDVLQWVLIAIIDLLKNTEKGFDAEILNGITNMVMNISLNVSDTHIMNLVTKLWKNFVKFSKPSSDMTDITSMINLIILNEWSSESLITIYEAVNKNFKLFNEDMLTNISLKYIYSNMITVNSNTNDVTNFKRNDMFELTSCKNNYIYNVLDYCIQNIKDNKMFDTFMLALLCFNIKDNKIARYFKEYFARSGKLSVLLKVFQMNDNSLYAIISKKNMSHFNKLGLPAELNKSFEDDVSSVFLSFKTIIMETILLQIKAAESSIFTQETIDGIIDLSYVICLNHLKDNTVSSLALDILINTLELIDSTKKFNSKQTSQLTTITMLFYENEFTNIEQMSKLFEFISKVLIRISEINADMTKILNESLDTCTNQSQETLEYVLNYENNIDLNTYKAFDKTSGNLTQLTFSNLKVFSNSDWKKLTYQVLKAWIVYINKSLVEPTIETSSINVSKIFLLSVSFIKEKIIHQIQHQTDPLSIEYLNDNNDDFIGVVACFINILYTKPEIVEIVKNEEHSDIKLKQVNDVSFDFDEFQKMVYCCYVGCLIYMNKNLNDLVKIKNALSVLGLILSFKNDWNIFVDDGSLVHEELISMFNIILQSTDDFDTIIFDMLESVSLKLTNDVKFLDMVYDYLGIVVLILQKYIPVINPTEKDLYQSLSTKNYEFIQRIFNFLVTFIKGLKNENMKKDLSLCVLNYLTKVINGVENLNYYFSSIIDALSTLLTLDPKVTGQFWKITRDKIDVEDVLLEGNYLRLMSVFISIVPDLSFNIDKFVTRLFNNCTNEELIKDIFAVFETCADERPTLNIVYKKGCKELLKKIDNYKMNDTITLFKFNSLMKNNMNPGSYKLILIFYSKVMLQVENDEKPKAEVKKSLNCLFNNDYDKLNEVVTSYSKDDNDYSFLL